jgi:hypothetical protein
MKGISVTITDEAGGTATKPYTSISGSTYTIDVNHA